MWPLVQLTLQHRGTHGPPNPTRWSWSRTTARTPRASPTPRRWVSSVSRSSSGPKTQLKAPNEPCSIDVVDLPRLRLISRCVELEHDHSFTPHLTPRCNPTLTPTLKWSSEPNPPPLTPPGPPPSPQVAEGVPGGQDARLYCDDYDGYFITNVPHTGAPGRGHAPLHPPGEPPPRPLHPGRRGQVR